MNSGPAHTTNGQTHDTVFGRAGLVLGILGNLILYLCSLLFEKFNVDSGQLRNQLQLLRDTLKLAKENSHGFVKDGRSKPESTTTTKEPPQWVDAVRTLCKAVVRGDVKFVSRMLKAAPSLASKCNQDQWSLLHAAVLSGNVDIVRIVLEQPGVSTSFTDKSDLDVADENVREAELGIRSANTRGATPLHYACMVGNIEIITMLLEHGAAFDVRDDERREPVEYFDIHNHHEALASYQEIIKVRQDWQDYLYETSDVEDLAVMIRQNKFKRFESSVRRDPDLATRFTYYDFTLLHLAVIRQLRPFVEFLLSVAPSTINTKDDRASYTSDESLESFAPPAYPHKHVKNATALHYACLTGNLEIIELLLKAGADWEIEDWRARKPEDLIHVSGKNGEYIKQEFVRLREEEAEKRKKAEEDKVIVGADEVDSGKGESEDEKEKEEEAEAEEENRDEDGGQEPGGDGTNKSDTSDDEDSNEESCEPKAPDRPLEAVLGDKLIGQRGPINVVANAIRLRQYGWVDPDRPLVMLFLGSSGVGKTELAKQIALHIHGKDGLSTDKGSTLTDLENDRGFVRIDMSEYQEKHSVSNLYGSPKGYVGYDGGGSLTQALKENPKAIVLLDEIEKAHPDILAVFLQVFDDGRLTDTRDGVIYCKDAVFIMTSNLASDEIKAQSSLLRELITETEAQSRPEEYSRVVGEFNRSIHPILKGALKRDEFLGRINQIVVFLPLNQDEIELVVKGELNMWRKRSDEKHEINLSWANEVVKKLALAYDMNYGVRSVVNEVQRIAIQLIADAHIKGKIEKVWHVYLTIDSFGNVIMKAADLRGDVRDRRGCRFPL
ncbi:hypothetical protein M0805_007534 [Coniferiporia weirii]|nr:hypothetical protein M0805_007534 [Coniferiporia weirii]